MSLEISKLENARERGDKIIARCPACAEHGRDEKGEHLVIMPDGRFGCVVYPGAAGKEHRKEIFALAGKRQTRGSLHMQVRRPASGSLPKVAGKPVDLGHLGTLGTGFTNPCAIGDPTADEGEEQHVQGLSVGRNASQASQPVPEGTEPGEFARAIDPDAALAFMRQLVGDRMSEWSRRFETVQAAIDCMLLGWHLEDSDLAFRLRNVDRDTAALASLHAGMVLAGAIMAGQPPSEAGMTAADAFCEILNITPPDIQHSNADCPF